MTLSVGKTAVVESAPSSPATAPRAVVADNTIQFTKHRIAHWNRIAAKPRSRLWLGVVYYRRLAHVYRHMIPEGSRVLEIGCGRGDLLAALKPSYGVGVDFSPVMLGLAKALHPELQFHEADAHDLPVEGPFDYIILSDLVNDLWNVEDVLRGIRKHCVPETRLILNCDSRLWQWPMAVARRLGFANELLTQNWISPDDLRNMLYLAGFEPMRTWGEVLLPLRIPLIGTFCNRYLAKLSPFKVFNLTCFHLARPAPVPHKAQRAPVVSVVVPARNEAGNIEEIFRRVPEMGTGTDLIFVEGNSTDDTYAAIEAAIARHPERGARLFRQPGKGKADAVRVGFEHARGEILMILDADLTVMPEDLPRFYEAIVSNKGEYINGVRLVYPMDEDAMRFFNLVANKFFSWAFSWLLGQPIKDTLCGTKVISRRNYELIKANRAYFGDFDPFGDFDLIFGAAKLNLRMVDIPIRYGERTYGTTNIHRWRHGMILLRMLLFAAKRLKFR